MLCHDILLFSKKTDKELMKDDKQDETKNDKDDKKDDEEHQQKNIKKM